jgi:histidinol-phosphate phosphatase family protein
MITFSGLDAIHARLDTLLGQQGAYLDDLLFCPHHPDSGYPGEIPEYKINCQCRKPKPGMIIEAASRYNIDLASSYMIGDSTADIVAGKTAGCYSIGIKTGEGLSDGKYAVNPDAGYADLYQAVEAILGR